MLMTYVNYFLSKVKNEKGQGMVEYALIIGLVSIVAIAALIVLGPQIKAIFDGITGDISTNVPGVE